MTEASSGELSAVVKLSELGAAPVSGAISANSAQCAALARRFDLPSIESLQANYELQAEDQRIRFTGSIVAQLHQNCAISGSEFPTSVNEKFNIAFVEAISPATNEEEIELESEDCDLIEYQDGQIDVGEAVAQTFYLALDPYPRGPDAEAAAANLQSEEEAGPFGALAALKGKLD